MILTIFALTECAPKADVDQPGADGEDSTQVTSPRPDTGTTLIESVPAVKETETAKPDEVAKVPDTSTTSNAMSPLVSPVHEEGIAPDVLMEFGNTFEDTEAAAISDAAISCLSQLDKAMEVPLTSVTSDVVPWRGRGRQAQEGLTKQDNREETQGSVTTRRVVKEMQDSHGDARNSTNFSAVSNIRLNDYSFAK
jgi:hypothetical protein